MPATKLFDYKNLDWQNRDILERNRMPARSFYCGWGTKEQAVSLDKSQSEYFRSLNGEWEFHFYETPFDLPERFMLDDFDTAEFARIPVPSQWQFHGYGNPHYTDAISLVPTQEPPLVQFDNPTGAYRKHIYIDLDGSLEYILRFDGVESAFHLWVNGQAVGYSQGSRNSAEFDITALLQSGDNLIAVAVYQYCDGSVIECQDMWTLGGIMRDVSLITRPRVHLADYTVCGDLDGEYRNGILRFEAHVANHEQSAASVELEIYLMDGENTAVSSIAQIEIEGGKTERHLFCETVEAPRLWTAETPELYGCLFVLRCAGKEQYYFQRVGFRKIELKDKLIHINGRYVKFRGMNRHDWSGDAGRCVTAEQMREDLYLMKAANINAIRTAHYPNMPVFYELCDEMGFYVISEADLECNQTTFLANPNCISDNPAWQASYLDRVERMVRSNKNATCIVIWSLGNESGYGRNIAESYRFCKEYDPTRLVHYEEDRQAQSADMYSSMYTKHADLERLGKQTELQKPHILCEYAHVMGNSPGGLEEYWSIINRYPRLQGGFLWEWIAHGIAATDENGVPYYRYGGDFGDYPNSGKFCTSGILSPDRKPFPAYYQLKKALEPVKTEIDFKTRECVIENLHSFLTLDEFELNCEVMSDGKTLDRFSIDISGIAPLSKKKIPLTGLKDRYSSACGKAFLNLIYTWRIPPVWAEKGDTLTIEQQPLPVDMMEKASPAGTATANIAIQVESEKRYVRVTASDMEYTFDLAAGTLAQIRKNGDSLLTGAVDACFWRAPLDNDRNMLVMWQKYMVDTMKNCIREIDAQQNDGDYTIRIRKTFAPLTMDWGIDVEFCYIISADSLKLKVFGKPYGTLPDILPREGIKFAVNGDYDCVQWFGRGPQANYPDSLLGTPVGVYEQSVDMLYTPFIVPQENGARCHVSWLALKNKSLVLRILSETPISFSALPYSSEQLERATHQNELIKSGNTFIHLDAVQHGLGSASWGPETLPEHSLKPREFELSLIISLEAKEDL